MVQQSTVLLSSSLSFRCYYSTAMAPTTGIMSTIGQPSPCQGCGVEFPSKNAVFRHLNDTAGACLSEPERRDYLEYIFHSQKREKVVLLYGYWIPTRDEDHDDDHVGQPSSRKNGEDAAQQLLEVIESLILSQTKKAPEKQQSCSDNGNTTVHTNTTNINRSYGHASRGSSRVLAQDDGTGAVTEVLTTKLPRLPVNAIPAWLDTINQALEQQQQQRGRPSSSSSSASATKNSMIVVRLLGRQPMPLMKFNAEMDVTHRRVEYLLPFHFFITPEHDAAFFEALPFFGTALQQPHNGRTGRPVDLHLDYMTRLKRIMQSLSTHVEVLDTNDATAVLEKGFHNQKRKKHRDLQKKRHLRSNATSTSRDNSKEDAGTKEDTGRLEEDDEKGGERTNNRQPTDQQNDASETDQEPLSEKVTLTLASEEITNQSSQSKAATSAGKTKKTARTIDERKRDRQREYKLKKKRIMAKNPDKKEGVLRRKRYHNFTPTSMAHEFHSYRRLDRFFHRATLRLPLSTNNNDTTEISHPSSTLFFAFCLSGDMFLQGQVPRLVGLLVALARGVVETDFIDCVFDEHYPHLVPTPPLPKFALLADQVSYTAMEGKINAILTPRVTKHYEKGWNDLDTAQRVNEWHVTVRDHVAQTWLAQGADEDGRLIAAREWTETVLKPWAIQAQKQLEHYRIWKEETRTTGKSLADSSVPVQNDTNLPSSVPPPLDIDPAVPPIYQKVLHYLRQADASGLWPSTNAKRQLVMVTAARKDGAGNASGVVSPPVSLSMARLLANKNEASTASAYSFVEGQGGASGSFSVGAMPGDRCDQPKGNVLFPELMKAAFELERILCPDREPSSTIAVNRNAQFRPHTDSGAGAGQCTSLIVGLGTYSGGELVVEGEQKDIRYQPIEFNGWKQRHWTMPFLGERFSLVWFTPKGCEGVHGIDL